MRPLRSSLPLINFAKKIDDIIKGKIDERKYDDSFMIYDSI